MTEGQRASLLIIQRIGNTRAICCSPCAGLVIGRASKTRTREYSAREEREGKLTNVSVLHVPLHFYFPLNFFFVDVVINLRVMISLY